MRYIYNREDGYIVWYTKDDIALCDCHFVKVHSGSFEDFDAAIPYIPENDPLTAREVLVSDEDANMIMLEMLAHRALNH